MSFHICIDKDGARSAHDAGPDDDTQAPGCIKITVGPGVTKLQALRWMTAALRTVTEEYDPTPDVDEQPVAAGEAAAR